MLHDVDAYEWELRHAVSIVLSKLLRQFLFDSNHFHVALFVQVCVCSFKQRSSERKRKWITRKAKICSRLKMNQRTHPWQEKRKVVDRSLLYGSWSCRKRMGLHACMRVNEEEQECRNIQTWVCFVSSRWNNRTKKIISDSICLSRESKKKRREEKRNTGHVEVISSDY